MIRRRDPARMKPDERLVEIATLLATAYRRMCAQHTTASQDPLDSSAPHAASCDQMVNGDGVSQETEVA